ncbi:hypothetical protein [Rhodococcus koreensis]|nr:hypothetical protein [Rhodococcus koreensis]
MFGASQGDGPELVEVGEVGDGEAFRSGLVILADEAGEFGEPAVGI